MFQKIGAAGACILSNVVTALVIIALIFIAAIEPPTKGSFLGYSITIYLGSLVAVLSNLSTGNGGF